MAVSINWGVLVLAVLVIRARLLGVHIRRPGAPGDPTFLEEYNSNHIEQIWTRCRPRCAFSLSGAEKDYWARAVMGSPPLAAGFQTRGPARGGSPITARALNETMMALFGVGGSGGSH